MSARKVFSIIGICISALLIIFIFLPFYDLGSYGGSYSLWEYLDKSKAIATAVIIILELLLAVIAFILQLTGACKDSKLAYLGLGYYFTYHISIFCTALSNEAFDELSFGFWLGFIFSIIAVAITIIGNCVSNEKNGSTSSYGQPVGFDPKTGKPIYDKPKQIVGYDPQTGRPIYE